jgi:CheY-like chemotaxis protein
VAAEAVLLREKSKSSAIYERECASNTGKVAFDTAATGVDDIKEQFALMANLSHELRTPLNGILGMAQALATEPLAPAIRDRIERLVQAGQALATIVDRFLEPSPRHSGPATALAASADVAGRAELADELHVLVAEDHPANRAVFEAFFQMIGVTHTMVCDGRALVETWRAGGCDIIVTDVQMPVMDGVAAARAIRREEHKTGAARIPILAVTANAVQSLREADTTAAFDRIIAKPVQFSELIEAIQQASGARIRAER